MESKRTCLLTQTSSNIKWWKWMICLIVLLMAIAFTGEREAAAQPTSQSTCTVRFGNSKGVVSNALLKSWGRKVPKGTVIQLPKTNKSGYRSFWTVKTSTGTKKYAVGASYKVTGNVTFSLARYKLYDIQFYTANGNHEYTYLKKQFYKGQTLTLPTVPSNDRLKGIGWSTSKNSSKASSQAGTKVKVTGAAKYYGVFQKVRTVRLYDQNGKLYRTSTLVSGQKITFPGVDTGNNDMFLGWSAQMGKTRDPEYFIGDTVPQNASSFYMVVFPEEQDYYPADEELVHPSKYDRVYFVGDSRTVGMRLALGNAGIEGVDFVCRGSQGVKWLKETAYQELLDKIQNEPKSLKKAVVFNLGVNDMSNTTEYVEFMKNTVAKDLKRWNCNLYYMSVNPLNSVVINKMGLGKRTEKEVEFFNRTIRTSLCTGSNAGFTYIDTCTWLKREGWISNRGGIRDGLHYSPATYRRIYNYCMKYIDRK